MYRFAVSLLSVLIVTGGVEAADRYWDGADTGADAQGGSGTWDTSTANWDDALTGGSDVTWPNTTADRALFVTAVGTVDLATDISLGEIDIRGNFGTGAYAIGDPAETSTLNFGGASMITLSNVYATFRSGISGAPDVDWTTYPNVHCTLLLAPVGSLTTTIGTLTTHNTGNHILRLQGTGTSNTIDAIFYQRTGAAHRFTVEKEATGTWQIGSINGTSAHSQVRVKQGTLVVTGNVSNVEWIQAGDAPNDDAILEFSNPGATLSPSRLIFGGGVISNSTGGTLSFSNPTLTMQANGVTFTGGDFDLGAGSASLGHTDNPVTVAAGVTVTIGGTIDDSTVSRNLIKRGEGSLILTGNSTYDGSTVVEAGTLSITNAYLDDNAAVYITNGATLNLDFSGTDTIFALYLDGVATAAGTWGAPGSGADNTTNLFSGGGILSHNGGLAPAGTWYWDGANYGGTGDGVADGGDGIWSISSNNWDHGLVSRKAWPDTTNDLAIFRTAAGAVDLDSDITLGHMLIEGVDNYYIGEDTEPQSLNFGGLNSITTRLVRTYIRAGITGSPSLHVYGGSTDPLYLRPKGASMTLGEVTIGGAGAPNNPVIELGGTSSGNSISQIINGNNWSFIDKKDSSTWTVGDMTVGTLSLYAGTFVLNGTFNKTHIGFQFTGGTLKGTGTINMDTTVPVGGTLAPGDPTGTLTVTNNDCTINGTLKATVNGGLAGALDVDGTLDIGAATLDLNVVGSATAPNYIIATYNALTGTFASMTNVTENGWVVDYAYKGENAIALLGPPSGTVLILR